VTVTVFKLTKLIQTQKCGLTNFALIAIANYALIGAQTAQ